MAKTATFSLLLGLLIAWNWGRLETDRSSSEIVLMILLGSPRRSCPRSASGSRARAWR